LLIPENEATGKVAALDYDDAKAHVMDVPNFWVPFSAWLEGEKMEGRLNKGQNDKLHRLEQERCENYTFPAMDTEAAWYRHYIDCPENIGSKEVILNFDGIALISSIYFNGKKIQDHIGMFSSQKINVTDLIKPGRNVVAVQVRRTWKDELSADVSSSIDDQYANAWNIITEEGKQQIKKDDSVKRFDKLMHDHIPHGFFNNNPGGIWQGVTLVITEKTKIEEFYFKPSLTGAEVDVTYANYSAKPQNVTLNYEIINKATGELLCGGLVENVILKPDEIRTHTFTTPTVAPKLWGPATPNLYTIQFTLLQNDNVLDQLACQVGFRTIAIKGDQLILNGKPYWVRGANHMPGHMRPYDKDLAKKWMELALEYNVVATRTHCSPYSEQWMDAADEAGVLISVEGPYPWMLREIPSRDAIDIWKRDMAEIVKANRNRPSVFLWTMNNEMKFFTDSSSAEVKIEKGLILTEGMKMVRKMDPTRPVVADSAYYRSSLTKKGIYEQIVIDHGVDEGDLDDPHGYFNWYNNSVFHYFKGEFGNNYNTPGRALMGQEISTGYPRADDALPTRAYLFLHQTPQTTVGKDAYEESNPEFFITRHAMLTKELLEMFRRVEHERSCGLMIFAFHTWFYNNHDVNKVSPMLTATQLKMAYQPVLASAELWGRHFYAGDTLKTDISLINDDELFNDLNALKVICQLVDGSRVIASQELDYGTVAYYTTQKKPLNLPIPADIGKERIDGQLVLRVMANGKQISKNEYDVILANKNWAFSPRSAGKDTHIILEADAKAKNLATLYGLQFKTVSSVEDIKGSGSVLLIAEPNRVRTYESVAQFIKQGGKAILLNNGASVVTLLPDLVQSYKPYRHEIVTMNRKEHDAFDGLKPLDIAWFTDGRNIPYAANGRFTIDRLNPKITALAETLEWHGYLRTPLDYQKIGGVPLFEA
ncbi:MAG: hypothetical protein FJ220_04785, partial [Kiritimatiellaceae bacterium]|nr:hypothetical protein [Kiritimatiellaceae bacterium]